MQKLFTSESVTEGHPDKICDLISDAILDECLRQDENSRVAVETAVTTNYVLVFGEITTNAKLDIPKIVKDTIYEIGYTKEEYGFDFNNAKIDVLVKPQSLDIARGVNKKEQGAGDQGLMFGYANIDTIELYPLPISLAHKLAERLSYVRKNNIIKGLRPDGKTQVTVLYNEKNEPIAVDTVVLSTQHDEEINLDELKPLLIEHVILPIIDKYEIANVKYKINPTGRFVQGGPNGDAGLTGRKIIVDTYGGFSRHGGGAFSGKDPSKVDRSAAYMARYLAKNIVGAGVCDECEIQLSYAIGISEPISFYINTFNTERVPIEKLYEAVKNSFDLTPKGIIDFLKLKKPIYKRTAAYGHFGKQENGFTWEKLDSIAIFRNLL